MLKLQSKAKIYWYNGTIDMRKSINGLCAIVVDELSGTLQSGDCFIFINKNKNRVKILLWDKGGFVIYYKRLEHGKFKLPKLDGLSIAITETQLSWLLAGLDFYLMEMHSELHYAHYY